MYMSYDAVLRIFWFVVKQTQLSAIPMRHEERHVYLFYQPRSPQDAHSHTDS